MKRLHVLLGSAVTWIGIAATVVSIVWAELVASELLPDGVETDVGRWVGVVLAVLAAVVSIIRRVTPVLPDDRGLLGGE